MLLRSIVSLDRCCGSLFHWTVVALDRCCDPLLRWIVAGRSGVCTTSCINAVACITCTDSRFILNLQHAHLSVSIWYLLFANKRLCWGCSFGGPNFVATSFCWIWFCCGLVVVDRVSESQVPSSISRFYTKQLSIHANNLSFWKFNVKHASVHVMHAVALMHFVVHISDRCVGPFLRSIVSLDCCCGPLFRCTVVALDRFCDPLRFWTVVAAHCFVGPLLRSIVSLDRSCVGILLRSIVSLDRCCGSLFHWAVVALNRCCDPLLRWTVVAERWGVCTTRCITAIAYITWIDARFVLKCPQMFLLVLGWQLFWVKWKTSTTERWWSGFCWDNVLSRLVSLAHRFGGSNFRIEHSIVDPHRVYPHLREICYQTWDFWNCITKPNAF